MLEEDSTARCEPWYTHQTNRCTCGAGTVPSEVVLGDRKVPIQRPRVRTTEGEAPVPRLKQWRTPIRWIDASSSRCPPVSRLGGMRGAWNQVVPKSTVVAPARERRRRRFVAKTGAQFETWQAALLDDLALVWLLLDGVRVGEPAHKNSGRLA
jgi:putative transposase